MYDPCGWKAHHDGRANAGLALQIQGAFVLFNESLDQQQAETGALVLAVQAGVDLAETRERLGSVFTCGANAD